jgi:uncharacterized membrane protein YgcG
MFNAVRLLQDLAAKSTVLFFTLLLAMNAIAQEAITRFDTYIDVRPSGDLIIEEKIRFQAEGDKIQRGMYRDIPTFHGLSDGAPFRVEFEMIFAERDGGSESYRIENLLNGKRIYLGQRDYFLPFGEHEYTLKYRMKRHIQFYTDRDELFFNGIGHAFAFPIESGSVTVNLPSNTPDILDTAVYTGPKGERGQDAKISVLSHNQARFDLTRSLAPNEGMSIVIAWPKGVVYEPTFTDQLNWYLHDNVESLVGGVFLLITFIFLLTCWIKVGRNAKMPAVIARYKPPRDLSPAACDFILNQNLSDRGFAGLLTGMIVKDYLTMVTQPISKAFTLTRVAPKNKALDPFEKVVATQLFKKVGSQQAFGYVSNPKVGTAQRKLTQKLKKEYGHLNDASHSAYAWFGLIIGLLGFGCFVLMKPSQNYFGIAALALILGGLFWGSVFTLIESLFKLRFFKLIGSLLFAGATGAMIYFLLITGVDKLAFTQVASGVYLFLLVMIVLGFGYILSAPTEESLRIQSEILGLKLYLSLAEQERLDFFNPPEMTPEHFESLLPYAIALGVETQWGEHFRAQLAHIDTREIDYNHRFSERFGISDPCDTHHIGDSMRGGISATVAATAAMASTAAASYSSSERSSRSSSSTSSSSSSDSGFSSSSSSGDGGGGGGGGGW